MNKEDLRTRVEAELLTGKEPRELEIKYDVHYQTILQWKKKLFAEKPSVVASDLTQITKASLEIIRDKAKDEAPKAAATINKLIDGVEGLKELEPAFHTALQKSVKVAQAFLDSVEDDGSSALSIKEWQLITSTLAQAYTALFNKSGTVVNVAQSNITAATENLAFFKASKKAI